MGSTLVSMAWRPIQISLPSSEWDSAIDWDLAIKPPIIFNDTSKSRFQAAFFLASHSLPSRAIKALPHAPPTVHTCRSVRLRAMPFSS